MVVIDKVKAVLGSLLLTNILLIILITTLIVMFHKVTAQYGTYVNVNTGLHGDITDIDQTLREIYIKKL